MKAAARDIRRFRCVLPLAALALGLCTAAAAQAQEVPESESLAASPAYLAAQTRWRNALAAFADTDRQQFPAAGGVLFVGSSTIRMWNSLAQDFRQVPVVINRGFGGSTMADCSLFVRDLVVRYKPRQVLVYAGDNDLAEGRTPMQILESFAHFAAVLREELPDTRISYISIKPSPSRERLLPQVHEANNIISAYIRTLANSEYIDTFTPMLDEDGRPRAELFRSDRLHLNDTGYRLWQSVIANHVPATPQAPLMAAHRADAPAPVPEPAEPVTTASAAADPP